MRRSRLFLFVVFGAGFASVLLGIAKHALVVNRPIPSDLILVPSGDFAARSERAVELANQGFGKQIVIDEGAHVTTFGRTLAERRIEETRGWSFPVTVCPVKKDSTLEESRECSSYLLNLRARRVLIVTSDFHTRRALAAFQKTMPSISFSVAAVASDYSSEPWWSFHAAVRTIKEWGALLWLKIGA